MLSNNNCNFSQFGIVGYIEGKFLMDQADITYVSYNGTFNEFGIVGLASIQCLTLQLSNANIDFTMLENKIGQNVSSLIGTQQSHQWIINQIFINNSKIYGVRSGFICGQSDKNGTINNIIVTNSVVISNGTSYHAFAGGITGIVLLNSKVDFHYISIISCQISSFGLNIWNSHSGGIIGEQLQYSQIIISNSQVANDTVSAKCNVSVPYTGGIIGKTWAFTNLSNSIINNNTINSSQQSINRSYSGGFIGQVQDGYFPKTYLYNNTNQLTNIFSYAEQQSIAGGIISHLNNTYCEIIFVTIQNIIITCQSQLIQAKLTFNYLLGSIILQDSQTKGVNNINNVQIMNCLKLTNIESQSGC
ncbi:Hypothetical_protein [Hexamita inflata]|uniref:Hypothetical_protein n=1 Tax=Hexamita inflata TaxID=28002 RepID=A0AA86Q7U9_9EUKA|nr:Hypothetical protein HINF_LOCUS38652 [Hexamita inflata]